MKRFLRVLLVMLALSTFAQTRVQVYFSPDGGSTEAITNELAKAKLRQERNRCSNSVH